MTHDDIVDEREKISRMEAIAYIECLLPELVILAASEPLLQHLLRMALAEAKQAVHRSTALSTAEEPGRAGEAAE